MWFEDVIGQQAVSTRLIEMVSENRLPHALMLCGAEGTGKKALALALASLLLGDYGKNEENNAALSGFCSSFTADQRTNAHKMLTRWQHPDLHFSYPVVKPAGSSSDHKTTSLDYSTEWQSMLCDHVYFTHNEWAEKLGNNKIAMIYEAESDRLRHELMLKSKVGGYKVAVIWQPESMNAACANKMLKLLEEPPAQTVFIMVSEAPELLLDTIKSRVQRIDVPRISAEDMKSALQQRRSLMEKDAERVGKLAKGSWSRALQILNPMNEERTFLDLFINFMRLVYQKNAKELRKWSLAVAAFDREKQMRLLEYFLRMIRENFMYNFHEPALCYMTEEEEAFAKKFSKFINEANVIEINETLQNALNNILRNGNPKMIFFGMALRIIVLIMRK